MTKALKKLVYKQNDIFILANNIIAVAEEKEFKKTKLLAKNRKKLILNTSIKVNKG